MRETKREQLEKSGYRVTTAAEFLALTPGDVEYVEMKVNLSRCLRDGRRAQGLTQQELAERLGTGQARVAKAESGEASFDALLETAVALGLKRHEIGLALAGESLETSPKSNISLDSSSPPRRKRQQVTA